MLNNGWLKLHRRLECDPIWTQYSQATLKVFIGCLLKANLHPTRWHDGTRKVEIPAGAFVTSLKHFAVFCRVSIKQLRTALTLLSEGTLEVTSRAHHHTLITICNWGTYQSNENYEGTERAHEGHETGTEGARKGQQKKKEEYNTTPPTPSLDDSGELFPVEPEPSKSEPKPPSPLETEILAAAKRIHDRHPKRKDIPEERVAEKLRTISKQVPSAGRIERVRLVDRNHEGLCNSWDWQKDNGQFVKTLSKWLCPSEKHFLKGAEGDTPPPPPPSPRPKYFVPQYPMPTIQPPAETEEAN